MLANSILNKIPVIIEGGDAQGKGLRNRRKVAQLVVIALIILIPVSGLFRIDLLVGAFIMFDRQIWLADFFLVFGFWFTAASSLVVTYSVIGAAFCGWACPQNTLSEWANALTQKLLGKHAEVELDGQAIHVSMAKNKILNWLVLGTIFLVMALVSSLIPMLYFYEPSAVWSFIIFQPDQRLAGSMYWIYGIFVLIMFLDIAFIRHFWCRFMCIYRVWQHSFKTKQTLHISYDNSQLDECAHCNFCVSSCIVEIDPRQTETYDACVNCGECINACADIRSSRKTGGSLLRFRIGERKVTTGRISSNDSLYGRVFWTMPLTLLGLGMLIWGIVSYEHYHMVVDKDQIIHGEQIRDYRISVANKIYQQSTISIEIEGLADSVYTLKETEVHFSTAERKYIVLHINESMPKGLHFFFVHARSQDGWHKRFRVHHLES